MILNAGIRNWLISGLRHVRPVKQAMLDRDLLNPTEASRYRNCLTIGCGKSFKFTHEDDWTCPDCKAQRAEVKRRQGVEGDLLEAMERMKA